MMNLEYSVVIRTLGTAGQKYQALLDSIAKQSIQPAEVIVVIPHDYELPEERLGYERFVRSDKGMVIQRTIGAREAKSRYCLFVDDDVCFDDSFIEKILEPLIQKRADVVFPIFRDMLPVRKKAKFMAAILATAIPCEKEKSFTSIIRTGGYSYNPANSFKGWYKAETAPGTCFFCERDTFLKINFEEELWLGQAEYELPEDQVMFYKFCKLGYNVVGVGNLNFEHLDAGKNSPNRIKKASFAMSCNKTIFWHRFIWKPDKNSFSQFFSLMCFVYSVIARFIYVCFKACVNKDLDLITFSLKGYKQAYTFLKSEEYKRIPIIK